MNRRMFSKSLTCWVLALFGLKNLGCGELVDEIRDDPAESLLELPPRGLSLIHAFAEKAEQQVRELADVLFNARIKNVAINVLCDSSFGGNFHIVEEVIEKLNSRGRKCYLLLYLTNGPSQRKYTTTSIDGFGTKISPEEFRDRIQSDASFQVRYRAIAAQAASLALLNMQHGGVSRIVPQLEDNQTDTSFGAMWSLLRGIVPAEIQLGRNPCKQCWPGNGEEIPEAFFKEEHVHGAALPQQAAGVVSNDGMTFYLPGQSTQYQPQAELSQLSPALLKAGSLGSWFILWNAKFQGLPGVQTPAADQRNYAMPTQAEKESIISFLRQ